MPLAAQRVSPLGTLRVTAKTTDAVAVEGGCRAQLAHRPLRWVDALWLSGRLTRDVELRETRYDEMAQWWLQKSSAPAHADAAVCSRRLRSLSFQAFSGSSPRTHERQMLMASHSSFAPAR